MLTIAITIIGGAAVWGYVNIQAGTSERAVGNSYLTNNNFLGEHFAVEDMYFGTLPSSTATFWLYNTGSVFFTVFSVRVTVSGGAFNLQFNYTQSGGTKTDYVYDLKSTLSSKCKTAASSYETPSLSGTQVKLTNAQWYTLTIPPTQTNCPSFGATFTTGNSYVIVVTGLYGNVVTYTQST